MHLCVNPRDDMRQRLLAKKKQIFVHVDASRLGLKTHKNYSSGGSITKMGTHLNTRINNCRNLEVQAATKWTNFFFYRTCKFSSCYGHKLGERHFG